MIAREDARLFQMVVTWITRYAQFMAVHRLGTLIATELSNSSASTVMGLMLQLASEHGAKKSLNAAIRSCKVVKESSPLFMADRRSTSSIQLVRKYAIPVSRYWGLWMDEFELNDAALKPIQWIVEQNREALTPRLTMTDADLSVWLVMQEESDKNLHPAELARRAGITRMQAGRSLLRLSLMYA